MKRHAAWLLLALATAACGGQMQYKDTNAAVNANPLCVSDPDQPNAPVSKACEREQAATWSSEREAEPVDFGGKQDDER